MLMAKWYKTNAARPQEEVVTHVQTGRGSGEKHNCEPLSEGVQSRPGRCLPLEWGGSSFRELTALTLVCSSSSFSLGTTDEEKYSLRGRL